MRCKTETLAVVRDFIFFTGTSNGSETFCTVFLYKLFIFPNYFRIFGITEVWLLFRSLQTVLFLIGSVFNAQFACFLVSMAYIALYKLWK